MMKGFGFRFRLDGLGFIFEGFGFVTGRPCPIAARAHSSSPSIMPRCRVQNAGCKASCHVAGSRMQGLWCRI